MAVARIYAGVLGPLALVAVLIHGLVNAASCDQLLLRAWLALCVFSMVGAVVGSIADRLVTEAVKERMEQELATQLAPSDGSPKEPRERS